MLFKLLYLTIILSSICRDDCLSVAAHIYVKSLLYITNCTLATVKFELLLLLLLLKGGSVDPMDPPLDPPLISTTYWWRIQGGYERSQIIEPQRSVKLFAAPIR